MNTHRTGANAIGIGAIACEIPPGRLDNLDRAAGLNATEELIREKIGVLRISRKEPHAETSDLGMAAALKLFERGAVRPEEIECLVVVTQNPDGFGLPHVSALLHGRLGLPRHCAAFDISLGCSGFVYALAVVSGFMQAQGLRRGLVITADPYSKIVDLHDRNSSLLFGDGATATLLTDQPEWQLGRFDMGSDGNFCKEIAVRAGESKLHMNGRAVMSFCSRTVPASIRRCLELNDLSLDEVDRFVLHQGSRHIVRKIRETLDISDERAPFMATDYGNTVSSSIPILLADDLVARDRTVLISGFGVGLSWASTVLFRTPLASHPTLKANTA